MTQLTIGIDVSKDTLDVCRLPDHTHHRFANDRVGICALIRWIGATPVDRIVFEATGAYHRVLERSLSDTGLPLCKVNPWQARRFAEARGTRAKTDKIDAAMLAAYGAMLRPKPHEARSQALVTLGELTMARRALVKDRTATKNRLHVLTATLLRRQATQRLKQIELHIKAIDSQCREIIEADPTLRSRHRVLTSIPGLGDITIVTLLAEMPEFGLNGQTPRSKPSWLGPNNPTVREMEGQELHTRRARKTQAGTLYARPRRHPLQSCAQSQVSATHRSGEAVKGRDNRNHEKTHHNRKRTRQRRQTVESTANFDLIRTDTLGRTLKKIGAPRAPKRVTGLMGGGVSPDHCPRIGLVPSFVWT